MPWLYLKGISTSDFPEALGCLGHDGSGLSPTTIVRMKEVWQGEYENFCRRSLEGKRYVYLWADGIYFNIRLTDDRPCVLVLMGATADGTKELIAMIDGQRESEQSWLELLLDAKSRGLTESPRLATGDGALGFWKALRQVYPATRTQRCWVHKTVNVLDKLPRGQQVSGKEMLHEIWMAATKEEALKAMDKFAATLSGQVPQGGGVSAERPGGTAGVLRLPRRALAAPAHQQPDRKHLRHGAVANLQNQRSRLANGLPGDGLQTRGVSPESLAKTQRQRVAAGGDCRSDLQRWNKTRRLNCRGHPLLLGISPTGDRLISQGNLSMNCTTASGTLDSAPYPLAVLCKRLLVEHRIEVNLHLRKLILTVDAI